VIDFSMPPLATWLDVAWLAIVLSCLFSHYIRENRKRQSKGRTFRATAVLVILVVFFPYLSASDDLIGLALLAPIDRSRRKPPLPFPSIRSPERARSSASACKSSPTSTLLPSIPSRTLCGPWPRFRFHRSSFPGDPLRAIPAALRLPFNFLNLRLKDDRAIQSLVSFSRIVSVFHFGRILVSSHFHRFVLFSLKFQFCLTKLHQRTRRKA
jgi:hypothetical protein